MNEFSAEAYYRLEQYSDGTLYEHFKAAGLPNIVLRIDPQKHAKYIKQATKKKIEIRQMGEKNPYGNV